MYGLLIKKIMWFAGRKRHAPTMPFDRSTAVRWVRVVSCVVLLALSVTYIRDGTWAVASAVLAAFGAAAALSNKLNDATVGQGCSLLLHAVAGLGWVVWWPNVGKEAGVPAAVTFLLWAMHFGVVEFALRALPMSSSGSDLHDDEETITNDCCKTFNDGPQIHDLPVSGAPTGNLSASSSSSPPSADAVDPPASPSSSS